MPGAAIAMVAAHGSVTRRAVRCVQNILWWETHFVYPVGFSVPHLDSFGVLKIILSKVTLVEQDQKPFQFDDFLDWPWWPRSRAEPLVQQLRAEVKQGRKCGDLESLVENRTDLLMFLMIFDVVCCWVKNVKDVRISCRRAGILNNQSDAVKGWEMNVGIQCNDNEINLCKRVVVLLSKGWMWGRCPPQRAYGQQCVVWSCWWPARVFQHLKRSSVVLNCQNLQKANRFRFQLGATRFRGNPAAAVTAVVHLEPMGSGHHRLGLGQVAGKPPGADGDTEQKVGGKRKNGCFGDNMG